MGELAVGLPIFYFYLVKTFKNCDPLSLLFRQKNILKAKKKNQFNKFSIIKPCSFFSFLLSETWEPLFWTTMNHSFGQL